MVKFLTTLAFLILTTCLSGQYNSPLRFTENKGQWPDNVQFRTQLPASTVWISGNELIIDLVDVTQIQAYRQAKSTGGHGIPSPLNHHAMRLNFSGASASAQGKGRFTLPGINHYYLGDDRSKWASNNRSFSEVYTRSLYKGVDLLIEGHNGYLKYDLIVAPSTDPTQILFTYEGADDILIAKNGELLIKHSFGVLKETVPVAYQIINGVRQVVHCRFTIKNELIGFALGEYDKRKELIIDPTLVFSTFSGSTSDNFGYTATFDRNGFLYSGSTVFGQEYPITIGAFQTSHAGGDGLNDGTDIAITKYDTTGTLLIWSTFLGGSADEMPHSLIVNNNDECFVFGTTSSSDFPTTASAFSSSYSGGEPLPLEGLGVDYINGSDMIITRLSADGSALIGSTYLGGSNNDGLNTDLRFNYADEVRGEVLLDKNEDVLIVSCTHSTDLPVTTSTVQTTNAGGQEGCLFKLTADLSNVVWGTYLGGMNNDALYSIDITPTGELFVAGGTNSTGLPVSTGAIATNFLGGISDAYMARITADGSTILASTYYGSANYDQVYFIESDMAGVPHIFGQTEANSTDLIQNAIYNIPNSGQLVAKLNRDFTEVVWSTRFGDGNGTPDISPTAFLVDRCNKIYIAGWGSSFQGGLLSTTGLPVTPDAFQGTTTGGDFYLAVFEDDMSALNYATFYGGPTSLEHVDGGTSRFDRRGQCYQSVCAGCGGNSDFPIKPDPGAWSATNNSPNCNNGVFKFDFDAPLVTASFNVPNMACLNTSISFDNTSSGAISYQWDFGDMTTSSLAEPDHTYAAAGNYVVTLIATNLNACNFTDTATTNVTVSPINSTSVIATADPMTIQNGGTTQLNATPISGVSYNWTPEETLNNETIANPIASPDTNTWYTVIVSDGVCISSDSLRIEVFELNCDEPDIFVPNAFSPNGDNQNDILFVRGNFITELNFRIFDRWGEKVFETTEQTVGWDGTYKGSPVDPAVFVYYLEVVCADGQEFFKQGNITVVE